MCKQRDTSVPRKHHADHTYRDKWGTTKTGNIHRVFYSFNVCCYFHNIHFHLLLILNLTTSADTKHPTFWCLIKLKKSQN